ncbi:MAG TPA: GtrA family protein [Caulobacteraceae bacterium]|nr:GtrA family protein [Caulobacteraceae bacterium]
MIEPMPDLSSPPRRRRRLLIKFSGVALTGFAVSALVLHLGLEAGLRPWLARLVALACAMNVTFLINRQFVFRAGPRHLMAQWVGYVTNSAFGNACNYWVFVTLESTHRPVIGNPYVALFAGSIVAWAINYTGARFLVFGGLGKRLAARCIQAFVSSRAPPSVPAPAEPESSRR